MQRQEIDPVVLDIVEGTVESARRQIELQIERTARSTIIRDQKDYRAAIYDREGRCISAVSSAANVDPILKKFVPKNDVNEGDVFIWNHPYESEGGIGQTPDICVTVPVISEGSVESYVQVFGHVLDIGGRVPGSLPVDARTVFDEGLLISPVKLHERGNINESLYGLIQANSRYPSELRGDIDAEINACKTGAERIRSLFAKYGREVISSCFEDLLERCADEIRSVILPMISDGEYSFEDFVETLGMSEIEKKKFVRLKVTLRKKNDHLTFDLNGTDPQVMIPINLPGNEKYYEKYFSSVFRALKPDILINEGTRRVVNVVLPKGTILSPISPTPTGNRHWTMYRLWDLCLGSLAIPLKGQIPGQQDTRHVVALLGLREDGTQFYFRETLGAGSPGRPYVDGCDAVSANVRSRNLPCEQAEKFYPIRVEKLSLSRDSGGAGKYRGGLGYHKEYRIMTNGSLIIHSDRMAIQPCGVNGGLAGDCFHCVMNPGTSMEREIRHKTDGVAVKKGDLVVVKTPGGGGWGNPLQRDSEMVRMDVLRGLVSIEMARGVYGVIMSGADMEIDIAATKILRSNSVNTIDERRFFDRGPRFEKLVESGDIVVSEN